MTLKDSVAILLAVYNGEKYLDALLDSLLKQDYPHIKIHIRDNCSTDGTMTILHKWQQEHPERICIYCSAENVGVIGNFANLLDAVDSRYYMFCDCDDLWKPEKVSKTLEKMKQLELKHGADQPLLVHTDLVVVDQHLKMIAPSFWRLSKLNTSSKCSTLPRLLVQNHVTGCTMLINRALKQLAVPIPEECVMHDWWLALVAACFGKVDYIPSATIFYRQHGGNDTGAKRYGVASFFNKNPKNSPHSKKIKQAKLLLSRYQHVMNKENQEIISAYLAMQSLPWPRKILAMLRYGFFKSGILRNLVLNH